MTIAHPFFGFPHWIRALEQELGMFGPSQDLADRALDITQDWLIDHIADEDMLYALHVKSGARVSA